MLKQYLKRKIKKRLIDFLKEYTEERAGLVQYQKDFEQILSYAISGLFPDSCDCHKNGEYINLKKFIDNYKDENITVFDVGANIGNYSKDIIEICKYKKLKLHCFEPSKNNFKLLQSNLNCYNATLNNFGLSDKKEKLVLYKDKPETPLASVYQRKLAHYSIDLSIKEEIELSTLDDYCYENNIYKIDLLKIDTEGHEFKVLQGSTKMLDHGKIKAIQFEFGGTNIDARTYFKDFWYLLNDKYQIYKMVKDGLFEITHYNEQREIFIYANFFLLLKETL